MTKHFDEKQQDKLMKILYQLSEELINTKKLEKFKKELTEIYEVSDLRHSYSEITKFVIHCYDDQQTNIIDILTTNIKIILEQIKKDEGQNIDLYSSVFKLYDHISMEAFRCQFYKESTNDANEVKERLDIAKDVLDKTYEDIEKLNILNETSIIQSELETSRKEMVDANKNTRNLQTQVISILGIFSAIIIAFFGGFSYFTSVFSNLHNLSKFQSIFFTCLLGFVIFNIVAFLLVGISYLIDKPLKFYNSKSHGYKIIYFCANIFLIIFIIISYCCKW